MRPSGGAIPVRFQRAVAQRKDVVEAIEAANAIKAKKTVPMHYKNLLGNTADYAVEQFKKGVTASEVVILQEIA